MKINQRFLIGGIWWSIVSGGVTIGCIRYLIGYLRNGNYGAALAAVLVGGVSTVICGAMVRSIFSD